MSDRLTIPITELGAAISYPPGALTPPGLARPLVHKAAETAAIVVARALAVGDAERAQQVQALLEALARGVSLMDCPRAEAPAYAVERAASQEEVKP